jgi:HK97 family phage prohead protease
MKSYEEKTVSGHVADIDDASRRVKVVMNEMGSLDLDQDVIDKTAFNKTIKERGPKGASLIWHLTDHVPMLKSAVGKPSEVLAQNNQLIFVTNIPGTTWGNDVLEFYKTGAINQHSIGFRVIKAEPMKAGTPQEYRLIKEVLLYEGSAVLWGANPNTDTLSVGKNFNPGGPGKKIFADS